MALNSDLIKKLKSNPDFQEYLVHIAQVLSDLDSLDGFSDSDSNDLLGEKLRARLIAKKALDDILQPVEMFAEKEEPTEQVKKEAGKRFGL